jgi:tRNA(fMet)-specific endonuclease VapC
VTLAELSVGPLVARDDGERAARQAHLQQAEADFDPLPFDAQAARAFGQVAEHGAP